jgi:inhibitor of KinA
MVTYAEFVPACRTLPIDIYIELMNFTPLGDKAVLIQLGTTIDEATHRRVRAVYARLTQRIIAGVVELVPAYASVAVHYDPAQVEEGVPGEASGPYDRLCARLTETLAHAEVEQPPAPRQVEIPVVYGGEFGPDLEDLAQRHGLAAEEVVRIHSSAEYLVYMIGFAPGFPYLGGLDPRLATARRTVPRTSVPAGSVGIGGDQTGVYPIVSPGGWHLIGRTPRCLFIADREPPTLLQAGDRVRFRAISSREFEMLEAGGELPGAGPAGR